MTGTTLADPPTQTPTRPAEVLTHLIIALLAPIFLVASGGDLAFARMAAAETVNQYRVRNQFDLISVAQMIAFSLTALSSLGLSVPEDLPLAATIRLRTNAVALNRAAENARRALLGTALQVSQPQHAGPLNAAQTAFEHSVLAGVAAAKQRAAEALASIAEPAATAPAPAPLCSAPAAPTVQFPAPTVRTEPALIPAPTVQTPSANAAEAERLTLWASAMTNVAHEFTADLKNLSPAEREIASHRAAILTNVANQLLSGDVPERPKAGDAHGPT